MRYRIFDYFWLGYHHLRLANNQIFGTACIQMNRIGDLDDPFKKRVIAYNAYK